jgi:hypothetical protein
MPSAKPLAAPRGRDRLLESIAAITIRIDLLDLAEVERRALAQHRAWSGSFASEHSHRAFLDRLAVNFLRHRCSDYDYYVCVYRDRLRARPDAAQALRAKVYAEIANIYPELAWECRRQLRAREGRA